jgi:hypothetical protein
MMINIQQEHNDKNNVKVDPKNAEKKLVRVSRNEGGIPRQEHKDASRVEGALPPPVQPHIVE